MCTPTAIADTDVTGGYDGWDTVVRRETSTPGGFSAVAEPAGPVDPEAAKRAAEEYAQKCILPRVEVLMTMGMTPGPPQECTAQVNTGAPLAAGPTTVSNEQVARLIPHGSGINRYPSGEIFVIFKQPMMVWTSPDKQTFNITLLGTPVEVEATPVSFNWDWGTASPLRLLTRARPTLTTRLVILMRLLATAMRSNCVLPGQLGGV